MGLFWKIVLGLIIAGFGFFMIYKTMAVQGWTGRIAWAEKHLGAGGTPSFIKLMGLFVIFLGIFVATGIIEDIGMFISKFFSRG